MDPAQFKHPLYLVLVATAELLSDCKQCCVKDDGGGVKYTSARLEVCPYKLK